MLKKAPMKFDKELFKGTVLNNIKTLYRRTLEEATEQQIFQAVSYAIKDVVVDNWMATQKEYEKKDPKIVYYMSMEFLMGRALGNNLINLRAYKEVAEALDELGVDLNLVEDQEPDPALGNGGLGRLAACFLDSLATLNYAAYGCGIRYRYGMFRQEIRDGYQVEVPDNWLADGYPFELRRPEYAKEVKFGGWVSSYVDENGRTIFKQEGYQSVQAVPYDMPIVGYGNGIVNTLRIWDAQPVECFSLDSFDKGASGTGNMKFMLNGALTLGTMDGANVEIVEEVGKENAFIFGLSAEQVIQYENYGGYNPMDIFNNDQDIRRVLMQLINGTYSPQDSELFRPLYNSLLNTQDTAKADTYFILADFKSYAEAQRRVEAAYKDEKNWAKSALLNVACAGKFSSDRTIEEYERDIWHQEKVILPSKPELSK